MDLGALVIAGLAALTDWWAVWSNRAKVESVAKPAVMVALLLYVLVAPGGTAVKVWIASALVLGLVGDVLLLPQIDNFQLGLAAFLLGHLAYMGSAFAAGTGTEPWLIIGAVGATVAILFAGRPVADAVSRSELHVPVIVYISVIGLMVTLMFGTGLLWPIVGATLFALSDGLLGWTRFVDEREDLRPLIHASYHVGQATIVVGLLAATS